MAASAEFEAVCGECGIAAGMLPVADEEKPASEYTHEEKVSAFVQHCYQAVLGRGGEPEGLTHFTELILSGKRTPKQVLRVFMTSVEFGKKQLGNEDVIRVLYRAYLYREADGEGLRHWLELLESGNTLDQIMAGFEDSAEFKAVLNALKD